MSLLSTAFRKLLTKPAPRSVCEVDWVRKAVEGGPPGMLVDVGAHFGESSAAFASLGWRVLAFEPDPDPAKQQAIRAVLNVRSRLLPCALSDRPSARTFYRSPVSTGISGLIPFHESHQPVGSVEVTTLKAVLAEEGIQHVDFLKIDAEGSDLPVLRGMDWCVKPEVILCEFEDAKTRHLGYTYRDLGHYLLAAGYAVYLSEWFPIVRYGARHAWRCLKRYPCKCAHRRAWGNFIAVSERLTGRWARVLEEVGLAVQ